MTDSYRKELSHTQFSREYDCMYESVCVCNLTMYSHTHLGKPQVQRLIVYISNANE